MSSVAYPGSSENPPLERFARKVQVDADTGCWEWTGARVRGGYGKFFIRKVPRPDGTRAVVLAPAHRWSYEHYVGPIPDGLEIDHLCRNKGCVNPDHLEPVTRAENLRRVPRATHCGSAHEFTPENTYYRIQRGTLNRHCRECKRIRARRAYWRKKKDA